MHHVLICRCRVRFKQVFLISLVLVASAVPALPHPHVWVTMSLDLVFNDEGKITAVNHAWSFDPAYAEMAMDGLDTNGDGDYSPDELEPLTADNMASLKDYEYFTVLRQKGEKQAIGEAVEASQLYTNGRLTLYFQVPLKTPVDPRAGDVMVKVYDPDFFIDFALPEDQPVSIIGSEPAGCKLEVKPVPTTAELDQTRAMLATKGKDWKPETAEDFGAMFAQPVIYSCAS